MVPLSNNLKATYLLVYLHQHNFILLVSQEMVVIKNEESFLILVLTDHLVESLGRSEREPRLKKAEICPRSLMRTVSGFHLHIFSSEIVIIIQSVVSKVWSLDQCLREPPGRLLKMHIKIWRHRTQKSALQAGSADASYKTVTQNWIKIFQPLWPRFLLFSLPYQIFSPV